MGVLFFGFTFCMFFCSAVAWRDWKLALAYGVGAVASYQWTCARMKLIEEERKRFDLPPKMRPRGRV